MEASWPQAPSRTPMGCPAGVRTFTRAQNIVPVKTEVGAQLHPGKPRGQGGRRGGLTSTLQGSLCRLFRITEAESRGKVNSSKWAPQGKGRGGCTACFFHCFVFEFLSLHNVAGVCCTTAWISCGYTHAPPSGPPAAAHPPLVHHRAPRRALCCTEVPAHCLFTRASV